MKKKILALLLALAMTAVCTACGGGDSSSAAPAESSVAESGDAASTSEVKGLEAAIAEQPILLTSVGQSADVEMVKVMLEKNELTCTMKSLATADDLGDNKTLILAVGGSSKGLGAAGIDATQELDRVQKLVDAADEKGLTIIAMHIGGEARRGDLSDKFIAPSFAKADYALIVSEGDKDGVMTKLAADAGIPMDSVGTMAEVIVPLKAAFK